MTNLYVTFQNAWYNLRDRQEGQTMAEYALVLALIVAVTAGIFTFLGEDIAGALEDVRSEFGGGGGAGE